MKRYFLFIATTLFFLTSYADDVENECLYSIKYENWKSTNKTNGSISSKRYVFQGDEGDVFSFDWVTSTEEYSDKLVVSIDGEYVLTKSGEDSGTYKYTVSSSGDHVVEFIYAKDYFSSEGNDEVIVKNISLSVYGVPYSVESHHFNGYTTNSELFSGGFSFDANDGEILNFSCVPTNIDKSSSYHTNFTFKFDGVTVLETDDNNMQKTSISIPLTKGNHTVSYTSKSSYYSTSFTVYYTTYAYYVADWNINHYIVNSSNSLKLEDGLCCVNYDTNIRDFEYTRTYNNTKWQSFYVPFSMSYDDWKADFDVAKINNVNMYDTNGDGEFDETVLEIIMVKAGTLKPNHPYLIKAKSPGEKTIKLTNSILHAKKDSVEVSSAEMKFTFVGTCEGVSGEEMVENQYYAMAGGALAYTEDTSASLKPYRWYMKVESRDPQVIVPVATNSRMRINVVGEDDITAVEDINIVSSDNAVYSLDGRPASKDGASGLRPGVYISNGKKILVK